MRSVVVTGKDQVEWKDIPRPEVEQGSVLLKIKACGICGSDPFYIHMGGCPPNFGNTPLGHEPSAEVVELGEGVTGIAVGDHVVVDTMKFSDGLLGSGGNQGALSEYVLVRDFEPNKQLRVIPKDIPWEVAALNEPMAVAYHGVNTAEVQEGDKVVIFGAGPVGLGALLGFKRQGAGHVVVVDMDESRLAKALKIGADAVINTKEEDLADRLIELHGDGAVGYVRGKRSGTNIYYDAAGAGVLVQQVSQLATHGAKLVIVAVHKKPVEFDFGSALSPELQIRWSMGYPKEIFEVTDDIIDNWEKYQLIIGDLFPFDKALDAITAAGTPGATDKAVVVFD